jgi:hypothetical protein
MLFTSRASIRVVLRGFVLFLPLFAGCFYSCPLTARADTMVPNTPAGQMLGKWLAAFDSKNSFTVQNFYAQHMPASLVSGAASFSAMTGGVDLTAIKPIDPLRIIFIAKDRGTPNQGVGVLTLEDANSTKVKTFSLKAVPKNTVLTGLDISAGTRAHVVAATAAVLNTYYVDPAIAEKMGSYLRESLKNGALNLTDGSQFAATLTDGLRSISHDKHLHVDFTPANLPPPIPPTAEDLARARAVMRASHCGFTPAQHLSGKIGLLKFDSFPESDFCADAASTALNSLGDSRAIIIDLRDNGGGDPAMVAYIASYFFASRTHFTDIWTRQTGKTEQLWTHANIPGKPYAKAPVFILTSSDTFSGAEDFSYSMQALKRAVIVGETTGGGAHPVSGHSVGDGFTVGVPFAKTINPVTHTNWEGVGVQPDVKVSASQALESALALARKALDKN